MFLLIRNLFNPSPDLTIRQQKSLYLLRHGLMALLSFTLCMWLNTLFDIPQYVYSFFACILFVYFDSAPKLWQQLIEIIIVSTLIEAICFFGAVLNPDASLSMVYFSVMALVLYTIGQYRSRLMLFSVFALYMLSFSMNDQNTWYIGLHKVMAMMVGTTCAMVSVSVFANVERFSDYQNEFKKLLSHFIQSLHPEHLLLGDALEHFQELTREFAAHIRGDYLGVAMAIEDIARNYAKLGQYLQVKDEKFRKAHFNSMLNHTFALLHEGLRQRKMTLLNQAYTDLIDTFFDLRQKNIDQAWV